MSRSLVWEVAILKAATKVLTLDITRNVLWNMARFDHGLVNLARMADGDVQDAERALKHLETMTAAEYYGLEDDTPGGPERP